MNLRDLTRLVLKLLGLYYVVTAPISVMISVITYMASPGAMWPVPAFINDSVYFLLGAALYWFPGIVVDRVIRLDVEGSVAAPRLLEVGLGLLGAYFTIQATYGFFYVLARAKWFYHLNDTLGRATAPELRPGDLAELVASVAQIAIGLLVWFWRKKMATLGESATTANNALERTG